MQVFHLPVAPYPEKTVTAIGFFDGVHPAHTALLQETVRLSKELGAVPALFTFSSLSSKECAPISTVDDRLSAFAKLGIEAVFIADFASVKDLSPKDFINDILCTSCGACAAVCGFNFHFGQGAEGDAAFLKACLPFSSIVPEVKKNGVTVSSSRIRALLLEGDVGGAADLLGSPYTVRGTVMHGKALGRTLGFPTANISTPLLLPKNGVYETRATVNGKSYPAMTDVGNRPTVEGQGERRTETHILGFDGDLYGKEISVSFLRRLRDEITFESKDALLKQLKKDATHIERNLSK